MRGLVNDSLISPLKAYLERRGIQAYVGGGSGVYYQLNMRPVAPDLYVILGGVDHDQEAWVTWKEGGRRPDLIIELTSRSTARFGKKQLYQDVFQTRDYFMFDPFKKRFEGWRLEAGAYVPVEPDGHDRMRCSVLELSLGVVDGWLRWVDPDGGLLLNSFELAAQAEAAEAEVKRLQEEIRRLRGEG